MFDDDDPYLACVRELAVELPGVQMKVSHGRPAWFTKKIFAYYGGSVKVDGVYEQHDRCVMVLPDPADRQALLEDERTFVPAYLGPYGWIGLDLDEVTDWVEVAELLDASYRLTAPRKLIAELDART